MQNRVFDELDMEYFEEHGLITDRHMINQEELEKLLDASVNMSKEELDAALDRYIPLPQMYEITSGIVFEELRMKGDLRAMVSRVSLPSWLDRPDALRLPIGVFDSHVPSVSLDSPGSCVHPCACPHLAANPAVRPEQPLHVGHRA